MNELCTKRCIVRDMKEIHFYPMVLKTNRDIKPNKLLLILSSENCFLCNGEIHTDNQKVIEYQLKLNNISDHFYQECYSRTSEYELSANEAYSEINSVLASTNIAKNKRFKISPFFNFWHHSMICDNWQMFECALDTDDFVVIKYKLIKKKHKNYCLNPTILFGATKENLQITFDVDDTFYYCLVKIGLVMNTTKSTFIASS